MRRYIFIILLSVWTCVLFAQTEQEEREAKRIADAQALYNSVYRVDLRNFSGSVFLGPALNIFGSAAANLHYGQNKTHSSVGVISGLDAGFTHPYIMVKLGMKFTWLTAALSAEDLSWVFASRLGIGSKAAGIPLLFSVGYTELNYYAKNGGQVTSVFYDRIKTPSVGFGTENWEVYKKLDITVRFEWLPVSVASPYMNFGMNFNTGARYKIWNNDIISVLAGADVDTYIFTTVDKNRKTYADWNIIPAAYLSVAFKGSAPK
ncbi:hypothetical protein V1L52_11050 [Treponema sp. HNW]|uniref:hypothetical protein n=1 Tax=Treponema sp. HNW TaxID=3116654 RepID=UPI003D0AA4B3